MKLINKWLQLSALTLVVGFGAVGCQNTAEGVAEDSSNAGKAIETGAVEAGKATQDAAKDTSAALSLTPKVKNAILMDAELKDPRNEIDVDSADNVVHLKGHVTSNEMKAKAGEIAQRVLKDAGATDKLSNELQVTP
jgi:osmotically-inducible protein OsmY